jgi:hypothetical protein
MKLKGLILVHFVNYVETLKHMCCTTTKSNVMEQCFMAKNLLVDTLSAIPS